MIEIKPWHSILNSDAPATYKDMEGISIGYDVYLAFKGTAYYYEDITKESFYEIVDDKFIERPSLPQKQKGKYSYYYTIKDNEFITAYKKHPKDY